MRDGTESKSNESDEELIVLPGGTFKKHPTEPYTYVQVLAEGEEPCITRMVREYESRTHKY